MTKGVVTYLETRFVDRIVLFAYHCRLLTVHEVIPILDEKDENVGGVLCVTGGRLIVRFLEWITDYRGKDRHEEVIKW